MKRIVKIFLMLTLLTISVMAMGITSANASTVKTGNDLADWITTNGGSCKMVGSDTVKLTSNLETAEGLYLRAAEDTPGGLTLDMNGHSIEFYKTGWIQLYVASGTLNITDSVGGGSLENTVQDEDFLYSGGGGELNIENVELVSKSSCITGYTTCTVNLKDCKLTSTYNKAAIAAQANMTVKAENCSIRHNGNIGVPTVNVIGSNACIELKNCDVVQNEDLVNKTVPTCSVSADTGCLVLDNTTVNGNNPVKVKGGSLIVKNGSILKGSDNAQSVGLVIEDSENVLLGKCTITAQKEAIKMVGEISTWTCDDIYFACTEESPVPTVVIVPYVQSAKLSYTSTTYSGSTKTPNVVVKDMEGNTLKKGEAYTVKWSTTARKDAGTYTATISYKGYYDGYPKKTLTFKILKKAQTIKASSVKKSVSASKLKKKSQTVTGITVTGAKTGKVYSKVSGSKKLSVSKTTGKITVKKGTKKGTYKIKVKVYAKEGTNYKKSSAKTATVTVKVK